MGEVEVIPVSALLNMGISEVREKLAMGSTSVFLGSSGVGKSTIVNLLLGEETQVTQKIRAEDSKGRHTTSSRELFFLPYGGMIIDTAGLREIQVLAGEESVTSTFQEVTELMENCRFSNCTHNSEPGCAITMALEDGSLSNEEYDNYIKLQKDAAFAERKVSRAKLANAKKRWKTINQNYKARRKFEGRD